MQVIGQGTSATVYEYGDKVIRYSSINDNCLVYHKWCLENQGAYGVPTIHALHIFGDEYIVVMKKYTCIPREDWNTLPYHIVVAVFLMETASMNDLPTQSDLLPTEYLETLGRIFNENPGYYADAHPGNIAFDGEEIIVLDPFYALMED